MMDREAFQQQHGIIGKSVEMHEIVDVLQQVGTQVKLLRVLENGEYMRIGSSTARKSDPRVIAATNKNLDVEVQQKRFRPDLYFRLRSVNIWIPPLRNRREDIPALIEQFVTEISQKNNLSFLGFTDDA